MDKIKKLIIFFTVVVLFSTFTSPSYAIGGGFFRSILKAISKSADEVITRTVDPIRKTVTRNKSPWKQLSESLGQRTERVGQEQTVKAVFDPLKGIGQKMESVGSKSKDKPTIKNISYLATGMTAAGIAGYVYNDLSLVKKTEIATWDFKVDNILNGLVKIISDNDKQFGTGFFLNNNTILTSFHVVNHPKNIKTIVECIEKNLDGEGLNASQRYLLSSTNKECEPGFIKITQVKKDSKINCLSKGGHLEEEDVFFCKNNFIAKDKNAIQIKLIDGSEVFGNIIAVDKDLDIALIGINHFFTPSYIYDFEKNFEIKKNIYSQNLKPKSSRNFYLSPLQFNDYFPLEKGFPVLAVGHPTLNIEGHRVELDNIWSEGKIIEFNDNSLKEISNRSENISYVKTDVEVNKGNSGGPLLYKGKVIGVINQKTKTLKTKNNEGSEVIIFESGSLATYYKKLIEFLENNNLTLYDSDNDMYNNIWSYGFDFRG